MACGVEMGFAIHYLTQIQVRLLTPSPTNQRINESGVIKMTDPTLLETVSAQIKNKYDVLEKAYRLNELITRLEMFVQDEVTDVDERNTAFTKLAQVHYACKRSLSE